MGWQERDRRDRLLFWLGFVVTWVLFVILILVLVGRVESRCESMGWEHVRNQFCVDGDGYVRVAP